MSADLFPHSTGLLLGLVDPPAGFVVCPLHPVLWSNARMQFHIRLPSEFERQTSAPVVMVVVGVASLEDPSWPLR